MNLTFCNTTAEYEPIDEKPIWHGLQFHHFGLIMSAAFGAFSIVVSFILIVQHASHYLKPWEQRHVLRILFMVPVYSVVSFLSYYYYKHTIYFEVIRDCYEAFAIASFFALLCHFVAPDLHGQKEYFRTLKPIPWIWPVSWMRKCTGGERGLLRTPRSGLTWFNVIWFCVFQYCFIRVAMTIVAVITQVADRYCLDSLSPAFAHVWVTVIEAASVTVAMICLIQFYVQLRHDLAEHQPFLKLLAIKLVVFLVFWQTIIINFLTSSSVIKPSETIAMPDVKIGIPAMLICLEMAFFSILHIWAYPWKVYDINRSSIIAAESGPSFSPTKASYKGGFLGLKAYLDAFNPWDIIKAIGRAFRWMVVGRRTREQDVSYKAHHQGTALQETVASRPGKYQPLGDQDEAWDSTAYGHAPTGGYAAAGDIGVVENFSSRPEHKHGLEQSHPYADQRTVMPGRIREDRGFQPAPVEGSPPRYQNAGLRDDTDTAYHGTTAYAAYRPPQDQAQSGDRGRDQQYRGPYGEREVDMPPEPGQWSHAR